MSYSKEQFIEDFKNAYNQSQQLHFIYRYVEDDGKNISSINFETVDHDVNTDVTIVVTLNDGEILRGNTIRVANDGLSGVVDTLQENVDALTDSVDTLSDDVDTAKREINKIKNGTTHLFESITDKYGNPRFVEGNITMNTINGITQTYGKWSLSGTHLMIVMMIDIAKETVLPNALNIANISTLPLYIKDKIIPLYNTLIDIRTINGYIDSWNIRTTNFSLHKDDSGNIVILKNGAYTVPELLHYRIQFDLLIDDR